MNRIIDLDIVLHRPSVGNSRVFTGAVPTSYENGGEIINWQDMNNPSIYRNLSFHYSYVRNDT